MPLSTTTPRGPSSFNNHHGTPVRRIPRGTGQKTDSASRMLRQAMANKRRIRGMSQRVLSHEDRLALQAAHSRLVEVIATITGKPEEVTTGTRSIIDETMDEARARYAAADKASKRSNPRKKTTGQRQKAKARPQRYTGEYHDEPRRNNAAAIAASRPAVSADPKAEAFQNGEYDPTAN